MSLVKLVCSEAPHVDNFVTDGGVMVAASKQKTTSHRWYRASCGDLSRRQQQQQRRQRRRQRHSEPAWCGRWRRIGLGRSAQAAQRVEPPVRSSVIIDATGWTTACDSAESVARMHSRPGGRPDEHDQNTMVILHLSFMPLLKRFGTSPQNT